MSLSQSDPREPTPRIESRSASPERPTRILLLAAVLGVCNQAYWQYSNTDHYWPRYWMPYIQGTGLAPEQYRVGVKLAAWWFVRHLHWGFRHGFMVMDVISSVTGVWLLYDLLQRNSVIRRASTTAQWFASAAFVMLVCFYLSWTLYYFRPETLPSTGLTAVMVWLWMARGPTSNRLRQVMVILGLLATTAVQAWIRADIPCLLNAGMFLAAFLKSADGFSLPRRAAILTSLSAMAVAAATQLYIMRVRYPHTTYGDIPVVMIFHDLPSPFVWLPFLSFIVPIAWTGVEFWRQRRSVDSASLGLVIGSGLYFILWVIMGKIDEVRIFIPFALALIPVTVSLAVRRLSWSSHEGVAEGVRVNELSRS
jgi:hypothetical protein